VHELYLVAHLGGVLLKLVINWWLFGCYTRRETTSVFGNSCRSKAQIKKTADEEWTDIYSFEAGTGDNLWFVKHGYYDIWIEPDVFYTVSIWHSYGGYGVYKGYACIATVFVYQEP